MIFGVLGYFSSGWSLILVVFGESEAGGTRLLGVLGTGAKIPFGFLELGS